MTTTQPIVFNPLDPAFRADPYPIYRRLLAEDPVHQTVFGVRAFARWEDCRAILHDHAHFSSDDRNSPSFGVEQTAFSTLLAEEGMDVSLDDRPFLFMDPPDHTRLRRLVNLGFTPRTVEALRPRIQQIVDELLDDIADKGEAELIEALAYPLPVRVICEMLGVPSEDVHEFQGWSQVLASSLDPDIGIVPEDQMRLRAKAVVESREYFRGLVEKRRADPRDDILSALIAAGEDGDKLAEHELLSTCSLILIAGHETTVNLIGNGVLQLLRHPDQLARFRDRPDLTANAIEELLRFDPPVQFDGRVCIQDTEIGGAQVKAGEFVMQLLGAANRDPEKFPDPNTFDIERDTSGHLAFGYGIHFCLGAPLARIEGQVALRSLFDRFPALRLETDEPVYKPQITIRGLAALPVSW